MVIRLLLLAVSGIVGGTSLAQAAEPETMRIGIPRSIFRDVPPALLSFANQPFKDLMKVQTGFTGEIMNDPDALKIAKEIHDGKLQLGVFLGHEFAWAKLKYPELEPLVIAVPKPREVQAFLLVRHDCKATNLGDLKGAKIVQASTLRDHAKLFLEKRQADELAGGTLCTVEKTATVHDAIHKVIDGDADITVADLGAWNYFQKLYPGPAQNLKVLSKSDVFPSTVIAYKKNALSEATTKKLRDGLLSAHENTKGATMMRTIKMEKFEAVPTTYMDSLKPVQKEYPAPKTPERVVNEK